MTWILSLISYLLSYANQRFAFPTARSSNLSAFTVVLVLFAALVLSIVHIVVTLIHHTVLLVIWLNGSSPNTFAEKMLWQIKRATLFLVKTAIGCIWIALRAFFLSPWGSLLGLHRAILMSSCTATLDKGLSACHHTGLCAAQSFTIWTITYFLIGLQAVFFGWLPFLMLSIDFLRGPISLTIGRCIIGMEGLISCFSMRTMSTNVGQVSVMVRGLFKAAQKDRSSIQTTSTVTVTQALHNIVYGLLPAVVNTAASFNINISTPNVYGYTTIRLLTAYQHTFYIPHPLLTTIMVYIHEDCIRVLHSYEVLETGVPCARACSSLRVVHSAICADVYVNDGAILEIASILDVDSYGSLPSSSTLVDSEAHAESNSSSDEDTDGTLCTSDSEDELDDALLDNIILVSPSNKLAVSSVDIKASSISVKLGFQCSDTPKTLNAHASPFTPIMAHSRPSRCLNPSVPSFRPSSHKAPHAYASVSSLIPAVARLSLSDVVASQPDQPVQGSSTDVIERKKHHRGGKKVPTPVRRAKKRARVRSSEFEELAQASGGLRM